jgi:integrase
MKICNPKTTQDNQSNSSTWESTNVVNLVKFRKTGIYYARARIKGQLFRQSLKTTAMSVAKLRLGDFIKEKRESMPSDFSLRKMTVGDAVKIFRERLDARQDIKENSKRYRRERLDALIKSWPGLETTFAANISKDDCVKFSVRFSKYSPTAFNATIGTLRMILDVAVEHGARSNNPAASIKSKPARQRDLNLPSPEQFEAFVKEIYEAGGAHSRDCGDLVRFLVYSGLRKGEASRITWADCDFEKGQIRVRAGGDGTGTKSGKSRTLPMIPDMVELLEHLRSSRRPEDLQPGQRVMRVRNCPNSMTRAAKKVGIQRLVHHSLRHMFITRCLEVGIDILTIAKWVGHRDGNLIFRVYGHVRDDHSAIMAQKVTFKTTPQPANGI